MARLLSGLPRSLPALDAGTILSHGPVERSACASSAHGSQGLGFSVPRRIFAFCSVGFVEWTRLLPEAERPAFINDVLDRYQSVAADRAGEENTFKFYQMDVTLARGR
jgi:hypothetical protein